LQLKKWGIKALSEYGAIGKKYSVRNTNIQLMKRWREGQTGIPIVDVSMRELINTGYTNNNSRQILAKYMIHDLKLDWRYGENWFR